MPYFVLTCDMVKPTGNFYNNLMKYGNMPYFSQNIFFNVKIVKKL